MKILITGGAGFIGSEVVRSAILQGHSVLNLDKLTYASSLDALASVEESANYHFAKVDIQNIEDLNDSDDSTVVYHRYFSQNETTEVWFYEVIGGGHDWPGAFGNQDIDASQLSWQFFSKYID